MSRDIPVKQFAINHYVCFRQARVNWLLHPNWGSKVQKQDLRLVFSSKRTHSFDLHTTDFFIPLHYTKLHTTALQYIGGKYKILIKLGDFHQHISALIYFTMEKYGAFSHAHQAFNGSLSCGQSSINSRFHSDQHQTT